MKKFMFPEVEVTEFDVEDIITTSGESIPEESTSEPSAELPDDPF